jgi:integrase
MRNEIGTVSRIIPFSFSFSSLASPFKTLGGSVGLKAFSAYSVYPSTFFPPNLTTISAGLLISATVLRQRGQYLAVKEWEWVSENPVLKVSMEKEPPSRDRWLTYEEEKILLEASPHWLKEITAFAVETGCRRAEILSLEWKDVDIFQKEVTVFGKKARERRTIPSTKRAFEVLKGREKFRTNVRAITGDLVFTHPPGRKVNIQTLRSAFEDALARAGVQNFRFHDLRHTFATRLAQTGVDPYTIQKLMGHTSFTTTQRYAHHFVESLRRGIESLEASRRERAEKSITNLAQFGLPSREARG